MQNSRRKYLKRVTGSTFLLGRWATPTLAVAVMPAHAEMSIGGIIQFETVTLAIDPSNSDNGVLSLEANAVSTDISEVYSGEIAAIVITASNTIINTSAPVFLNGTQIAIENLIIDNNLGTDIEIVISLDSPVPVCRSVTIPNVVGTLESSDLGPLTQVC